MQSVSTPKSAAPETPKVNVLVTQTTPEEVGRIVEQLQRMPGLCVAGTATTSDGLERIIASSAAPVHLLITDVVLGDADVTPVIARAKKLWPDLDVLVYTSHAQDSIVIRAILAGAMGYLLKGDQEDFTTSLRLLQGGGSPVSPTVARSVLRAVHNRTVRATPKKVGTPGETGDLSSRETEILTLLAKGMSFAEVGQILSISTHTVTAHVKKIYRKLQVHSRGEAVYEAQCLGLLSGRGPGARL